MKKYIFIVSVIFMFIACSSDDDSDNNTIPIEIKESELQNINISNGGAYYFPEEYDLFIPSYYFLGEAVEIMSCDAYCPKEHDNTYMYLKLLKPYPDGDLVFKCSECKAEFNYFSGKARNEEAKGYRLNVYKTEYDINNKIYTVWK